MKAKILTMVILMMGSMGLTSERFSGPSVHETLFCGMANGNFGVGGGQGFCTTIRGKKYYIETAGFGATISGRGMIVNFIGPVGTTVDGKYSGHMGEGAWGIGGSAAKFKDEQDERKEISIVGISVGWGGNWSPMLRIYETN